MHFVKILNFDFHNRLFSPYIYTKKKLFIFLYHNPSCAIFLLRQFLFLVFYSQSLFVCSTSLLIHILILAVENLCREKHTVFCIFSFILFLFTDKLSMQFLFIYFGHTFFKCILFHFWPKLKIVWLFLIGGHVHSILFAFFFS